jgi:nucleoside-diphosphate kinase
MVWEGIDVISEGRKIIGLSAHPNKCLPGTIRGDFAISIQRNVCHGSDSIESAKRETKLWFNDDFIKWEKDDKENVNGKL